METTPVSLSPPLSTEEWLQPPSCIPPIFCQPDREFCVKKLDNSSWQFLCICYNSTRFCTNRKLAGLCKGSTTDSDSVCEGSNPSPAAKRFPWNYWNSRGFPFFRFEMESKNCGADLCTGTWPLTGLKCTFPCAGRCPLSSSHWRVRTHLG